MALTRRAGRSTRLLVITLVMASLVIITVDYRQGRSGVFAELGREAASIVTPMQSAVSRAFRPIGSFFRGLGHIGSLESENRRLHDDLQRLRIEQGSFQNLQRQLVELQALINMRTRLNLTKSVGANVVANSISNFEWTITLDRGSVDGVRANQPVLTADGLVGHVLDVFSRTCTVQLIIDPRSSVGARLAATGETGLVVGERNKDLQMQLVPPEAEVPPGEQVVTSGYQGGLYPPGLPIGAVSQVYNDPASPSLSKIIRVRPAVDFASLEYVLIVTGPTSGIPYVPPSPTPSPSPSPSPSTSPSPGESPSP